MTNRRDSRGPLIGYFIGIKNPVLSLKCVGTPHEVLVTFRQRGLDPNAVLAHRHTEITSTEVFKTAPDLELTGGPHAETIVDILEALDEGDHTRAEHVLRKDKAALSVGDPNGAVPLLSAIYSGDLEGARLLLRYGAAPDAAANLGMTPLHWAAAFGERELAEELLRAGANGKSLSWFFVTPEELALLNAERETQRVISDRIGKRSSRFKPKDVIARMA